MTKRKVYNAPKKIQNKRKKEAIRKYKTWLKNKEKVRTEKPTKKRKRKLSPTEYHPTVLPNKGAQNH